MKIISSFSNRHLKLIRKLQTSSGVRKNRAFILEGPRYIRDYLVNSGDKPLFLVIASEKLQYFYDILEQSEKREIEINEVSAELFQRSIATTRHSQGIVAVCPLPEKNLNDISGGNLVLILDGVSDPGNTGTAIRSASAFGCSGVICSKGTCYPFLPDVTRASAGTNAQIPVLASVKLSAAVINLKKRGFTILGADMSGRDISALSVTGPVAVIIGSETSGLTEEMRSAVDDYISIPINTDVESLNAGVSASIILYALSTGNQAGK